MAETQQAQAASKAREPRTPATIGWSPERIRSAETRANSGYFETAADLCECIMSDDRASSALDRLCSYVSLPLHFEIEGLTPEESKADGVVQALDVDWFRTLSESLQGDIVRWLSLLGHCVLHVVSWDVRADTGRATPVVECWHQRNFRFDTQNGRWLARVSTFGTSYDEVPIELGTGQWVLLTRYGDNWRSCMKAPWRGVSRFWLLKQFAAVDWAASSERHGQGQTYVDKQGDGGSKLNQPQRDALAGQIADLGRNGVIVLPDGFKASLVTDGANTYQTFLQQITVANSAIAIGLLGTNLTSDVQGGSFAAASVHESVDAQKAAGLLAGISTGLQQQLWTPWAAMNFGDGTTAPYAQWNTEPPPDRESETKVLEQGARGLQLAVSAGLPVSKSWAAEWLGVKLAETPDDAMEAAQQNQQPTAAMAAARQGSVMAAEKRASDTLGDYQSALERSCCAHAAKELAPTLASVISAVGKAGDYAEARALIEAAYGKAATPARLAELTEAALIMAQAAGLEVLDVEMREG